MIYLSNHMKRIILPLILLALFGACSHNFEYLPDHNIARGLFSPVQLNTDTTIVYISDYIPEHKLVDSICTEGINKDSWSRSGNEISILTGDNIPMLSVLNLWVNDIHYSLLLNKSLKVKYTLTYDPGDKIHKSVRARGEFNRWNARNTTFDLIEGKWVADIIVNPGIYQYLLVLDGEECLDPGNPDSVNNNAGGYNSRRNSACRSRRSPWIHRRARGRSCKGFSP